VGVVRVKILVEAVVLVAYFKPLIFLLLLALR
jgi:hypothetical protein